MKNIKLVPVKLICFVIKAPELIWKYFDTGKNKSFACIFVRKIFTTCNISYELNSYNVIFTFVSNYFIFTNHMSKTKIGSIMKR